jgi:glyoxylase-like metal-dependent hydrolase (beta-lactamase superfamily II)
MQTDESSPMGDMTVPTTDADALAAQIDAEEPVVLLDVRMRDEFETWHIDGPAVDAINIPYIEFLQGEVPPSASEALPTDAQVTVICAKGGSSEFVAAVLADAGYDVNHLEDGMQGWARVYDRREITAHDGPATVYQYHRRSSGCLGYLIVGGDAAAVVDPLRAFTDRYLEDAAAEGADLTVAIDTHVHADHISALPALSAAGIDARMSPGALDRGVTHAEIAPLEDGETISLGDAAVEAVATPGHTTGMMSVLIDGSTLLTGDGLFVDSVARPDLEEGDAGAEPAARQLYASLQERILPMDAETVIAGAHTGGQAPPAADGTITAPLGEIVSRMPILTADESAFVTEVLREMPPRPANYQQIIDINLGADRADDATAFRLELGPNNCAASTDALTSS